MEHLSTMENKATNLIPLVSFCGVIYKSPNSFEHLIDNVSFSIYDNQITTVIGPNGAGKTTLLKLLLGLIKPQVGTIQNHKQHMEIGYMPQKLSLDPTLPLTVYRFLKIAYQKNQNISAADAIENVLNQTQLMDLTHKSIHTLSGGEWQRVLLARAILNKPNLLVLDEPVQCLDHNGQMDFYKLLKATSKALECAVVQVSHDLHLVWDASDTIICLNKHICCSGSPEHVRNSTSFTQLFNGYVPYIHHHDHVHNAIGHSQTKECQDTCSHIL